MHDQVERARGEMVDLAALFKRTWVLFSSKPVEHLVASLIVMALSVLSLGLLMGPLTVGQIRMIDKQRRDEEIRIPDVFSGFASFAPALVASVVLILAVALSALLFGLLGLFARPGLVIALVWGVFGLAWGFALWFIALRSSSAVDALAASWALLKARTASVAFVLLLVALLNWFGAAVPLLGLLTAPLSMIFATLSFCEIHEEG
jgi:hypothetical protein